jgi:hypothetical protein
VLRALVSCLDNIVLEVDFFKKTAAEFGLEMEGWMERKGTRDYTAEMARVSMGAGLEEGIVFLWAMEKVSIHLLCLISLSHMCKVYFDAWSYVKRLLEEQPAEDLAPESSRAAVEKFATNWSTPEFGNFVEMLGGLVDSLGVEPGTDSWARMEAIWTRVVELEVGFWPEDGEEVLMRK